eukprot:TRINITY_DN12740_c0_g2_i1.p1 TRINITY_DN12740_c0_g2~~TRINITY_DN12740_c0_g2_i1.p1  ORF type:complete len:761 (-),score=225.24 TRINITY_DN12740_c0_g2_i1:25-2214(-)
MAGAIACGYANVFVTAPSPENLKTLFEMVLKGFDALEYKEHRDYELLQSTNAEFGDCIVRINIFKEHRQTIQYIHPKDHQRLAQAELLVIDEAAAIPLPVVKNLFGPYLVFLSSTINGYEGTGRSLSLKLLKQLREQTVSGTNMNVSATGRSLIELNLQEPIRYAPGDKIEKWLNELLCLECTNQTYQLSNGVPHPSQCELYYVNRDTLFSYHRASEAFLQRMMSLYVSSHYKNSPNDLQLMSDAPAHHLFVLLGAVDEESGGLPDVLAVVQVCIEGMITRESVKQSLARGIRKSGDLIPWTISQQYQDHDFAGLSGARVVRVATHPDAQRMGYGTRALELLKLYFEGHFMNMGSGSNEEKKQDNSSTKNGKGSDGLLDEVLEPRKNLPPLLESLSDRPPEPIHWLGTSYGVTQTLFDFWMKNGYKPVYLRQTENDLTGEHTCIMLKSLAGNALIDVADSNWLGNFVNDFQRRFLHLLGYNFRTFESSLGLSIFSPDASVVNSNNASEEDAISSALEGGAYGWEQLKEYFTDFDLQRLDSYSRNLVDYHMILDLLPSMAKLVFLRKIAVSLSYAQAAILLAVGLQHKSVDEVSKELSLEANQVLSMFNKVVKKVVGYLKKRREQVVRDNLPEAKKVVMKPVESSLNSELSEAAAGVHAAEKQKQQKLMLNSHEMSKYAIGGSEDDWAKAEKSANLVQSLSSISVKSNRKRSSGGSSDGGSKSKKQRNRQ